MTAPTDLKPPALSTFHYVRLLKSLDDARLADVREHATGTVRTLADDEARLRRYKAAAA